MAPTHVRILEVFALHEPLVGTSRCDVPARAVAGGIVAPLNARGRRSARRPYQVHGQCAVKNPWRLCMSPVILQPGPGASPFLSLLRHMQELAFPPKTGLGRERRPRAAMNQSSLELRLALSLFVGALTPAGAAGEPARDGFEFFEKKIRPLIAERCYECHSADAKKL